MRPGVSRKSVTKAIRGSKVSEADQVEHQLVGGQWEGLGVVHKGGEIRIKVHSGLYSIGNGRY